MIPRIAAIGLAAIVIAGIAPAQTVWRRLVPPGTHDLPAAETAQTYSILISVPVPSQLTAPAVVKITSDAGIVAEKTLHPGDADLYTLTRGTRLLRVESAIAVAVQVNPLGPGVSLEAEPNNTAQQANPIRLGQTVWASGDEAPYFPLSIPARIPQNPNEDWYRFPFEAGKPKLVHFSLEVPDRDNIPVDVSVYRLQNGKVVEHSAGEDPVTIPHEVQALSGNKFTTRILSEAGTYYVRVKLTHPSYRLRTRVYDAPPYAEPGNAVQAGIDYLIGAGDSWHANTPRRGGVHDRIASNHQETTLCVACHATHFTQRAQLYANARGYAVNYPDQLSFLAERFYNNPRPFYGFEAEGAVWSRVISAAANVLGRMSHLMDLFERNISLAPRPAFHEGIRGYLNLYYKGRTKLPPDETNGNTPLVSAYEVAWYAWESTRDARIAALIEQDEGVRNPIDLCYQTLALAAIDRERHAEKIRRNAERILNLQREDGQWSARFEETAKTVEFQTGHALWALHAAGIPRDDPRVAKGLAYLLARQQEFGGWLDPLQSFENFRTPFRETQMAVLALSAYYPRGESKRGWGHAAPSEFATDAAAQLEQLNAVWDRPAPERIRDIEALTLSPEPLVRAQALEVLGRLALPESLTVIAKRMDDPSKIVMRAAALAMRQVYSVHPERPTGLLVEALQSASIRERWAGTRVFARHAAGLAQREELADALVKRIGDAEPQVAVEAIRGAWQFWYWTRSAASKEKVEDALLAQFGKPVHPWVEQNLKDAVYNLADENIRYLYNNWVPGLAAEADRAAAIAGRLAIEDRLSKKFANLLANGSPLAVRRLLSGLTEFALRRGDIYDPEADRSTTFPPVYNRIGNDIETIVFFGEANTRMAKAIAPHLNSTDPEIKRLAVLAGQMVRDAQFGEVSKIAGPAGPERAPVLAAVKAAAPAAPRRAAAGGARPAAGSARPDDDYFRGYVEPILTLRGADGQACVHCHASHTLFNATLTTARNVINLDKPEESLILVKPTSGAESEGVAGSSKVAHGGGVRFEKDSPEYNTILNWIRGAKP